MKIRKLFTLLMAVVLLIASLGLTVHADVESYSFSGSCKRRFTTRNYLEQSNLAWPSYVKVSVTELDYDCQPDHGYAIAQLVDGDGTVFGDTQLLFPTSKKNFAVPSGYECDTIKLRLFHPRYYADGSTPASTLTISGLVSKSNG